MEELNRQKREVPSQFDGVAGRYRVLRAGLRWWVSLGCTNLGLMQLGGEGIDKEMAAAQGSFKEACEGGNETGCAELGKLATAVAPQLGDGRNSHPRVAFGHGRRNPRRGRSQQCLQHLMRQKVFFTSGFASVRGT